MKKKKRIKKLEKEVQELREELNRMYPWWYSSPNTWTVPYYPPVTYGTSSDG